MILGIFFLIPAITFAALPCSQDKIDDILKEATSSSRSVSINCSFELPQDSIITKRLVLEGKEASSVEINCNNSTIRPYYTDTHTITISSRKLDNGQWSRPEDIVIKNCIIYGNVRFIGQGTTGNSNENRISSYSINHTLQSQAAAPTRIRLEKLKINGDGRTPIYLGPGVNNVTLINSELTGKANSVALYMDAETSSNEIRNNYIHVESKSREQVAVDGSAYNLFVGNTFGQLNNGGIFLYRNCGEGGAIRHQPPKRNKIINNVFYYHKYKGNNPAVNVTARNGGRYYCDYDKGYPYGSSASNKDYARDNVIAQNQFVNRNPSDLIAIKDRPNYAYDNIKVSEPTRYKSGCFFLIAGGPQFVEHGDYAAVLYSNGKGAKYWCNDGDGTKYEVVETQISSFSCQKINSNSGCDKVFNCPDGKKLVSIRAACDLENGNVDKSDIPNIPWNTISVLTESDKIEDGFCRFDGNAIRSGEKIVTQSVTGQNDFFITCKEHDKNGGDCEMSGDMLCL